MASKMIMDNIYAIYIIYILVCLWIDPTFAISMPYESAPKNYFGSPAVWNGYCDKKEEFIAMFHVPEQFFYVSDKPRNIWNNSSLTGINISDIEALYINVLEDGEIDDVSEFQLTPIQDMPKLRHLWINGSIHQDMRIHFNKISSSLKTTLALTHLHIYMRLYSFPEMLAFLRLLKYLEVLDVYHAVKLSNVIPLQDLFQALAQSPVSAISLRHIQEYGVQGHEETLNFTAIIPLEFHETLTYLDLSQNSIFRIYLDLLLFPKLVFLDMSQNRIVTPNYYADQPFRALEGIVFHPSLQVIEGSRQGVNSRPDTTIPTNALEVQEQKKAGLTSERFRRKSETRQLEMVEPIYALAKGLELRHEKKRAERFSRRSIDTFPIPFFRETFGDERLLYCFSQVSNNINEIVLNRTIFAGFLNCMRHLAYPIPSDYIPALKDILNSDCDNDIEFPISPNLHDVRFDHVSYDIIYYHPLDSGKPLCLGNNSIYSVTASYNEFSQALSEHIFTTLHGLTNLVNLELDGIDSLAITNTTFRNFPNIARLRIGYSTHRLSDDLKLCHQLPKLAYFEMANAQLAFVPSDLLNHCTELKHLDLSGNKLQFLPLRMREMLNALASGHTLTVDLSNNVFSCHCHDDAIRTIKWIHQSMGKIRFVDHATYKCIGYEGIEFVLEKNLDAYEMVCHPKENTVETVLISIGSSTAFYISILMLFIIHRYRYRIRTHFFRALVSCRKIVTPKSFRTISGAFKYDIYLTYYEYNQTVFPKVSAMLERFEHVYGLKCCVPDRDFPASELPHKNITDFMEQSRTILFLVSRASLSNTTFRYEQSVASSFETTRMVAPLVLFIFADDTGSANNGLVQNLKQTKHCYDWPFNKNGVGSEKSQREFLDKLVSKVVRSIACSTSEGGSMNIEMGALLK